MQKERLIIRNFFTLTNIDIDLAKFNIFIGEQASGKSLLVKLIYFFRNVLRLPITNYQNNEEQLKEFVITYFKEILRLETTSHQQPEYYIEYEYNQELRIIIKNTGTNLEINISDNLRNIYDKCRTTLINIHAQMAEQSTYPANLQYGIMQTNVSQVLKESIFGENSLALFFPAGRTFLVSLQRNLFNTIHTMNIDSKLPSIDPLLLLFGQQYQSSIDSYGLISNNHANEIIHFFEELSSKIIKGNFVNDSLGGYISQISGDVRPWNSSSGQQEFLPIYLVLRNYLLNQRGGYLYIEEPEAHLYPTAQKHIIELLVYVTKASNSLGLNITTHSPYLLTVLNNLILANEVKEKVKCEKNLLVSFDDVSAFYIGEGKALPLMNEEHRIIDAEKLDEVSNTISNEFSKMVDLL